MTAFSGVFTAATHLFSLRLWLGRQYCHTIVAPRPLTWKNKVGKLGAKNIQGSSQQTEGKLITYYQAYLGFCVHELYIWAKKSKQSMMRKDQEWVL